MKSRCALLAVALAAAIQLGCSWEELAQNGPAGPRPRVYELRASNDAAHRADPDRKAPEAAEDPGMDILEEEAIAVAADCDRLTADPADRDRADAGVDDDQIIPAAAVKACAQAADLFDEPRFVYQLARALAAADRKEDAIGTFEESGYCPANFYLGRAAEQGWTGAADIAQAQEHYKSALACGYSKAQAALNRITFDASIYLRPELMKCLYYGDVACLNRLRPLHASYVRGLFDELGNQWIGPEKESGTCAATLFEPGPISYALDSAQNGDPDGPVTRIATQAILRVLLWFEPTYGQEGLEHFREILKKAGHTDAVRMVRRHTCEESPIAKQIAAGVQRFSQARKPVTTLAREWYQNPEASKPFRERLMKEGLPQAIQILIFQ